VLDIAIGARRALEGDAGRRDITGGRASKAPLHVLDGFPADACSGFRIRVVQRQRVQRALRFGRVPFRDGPSRAAG